MPGAIVALLLFPFNRLMRLIQNMRLKSFFGTILEEAAMVANFLFAGIDMVLNMIFGWTKMNLRMPHSYNQTIWLLLKAEWPLLHNKLGLVNFGFGIGSGCARVPLGVSLYSGRAGFGGLPSALN